MAFPIVNQCTAKSKSTGKRCQRNAMKGMNVCHVHGGKTPKGIASPNYKTGKYSRYTSGNIAQKLERFTQDPDLLNLYEEIKLITARIDEKLDRLDTIDASEVHKALKALVVQARKAYKNSDYGGLEGTLDTLEDVVNQRILHYQTDEDIRKDLETRRKLIETQRKLNADAEQLLTASQVYNVLIAVGNAIKERITDNDDLAYIQNALAVAWGSSKAQQIEARQNDAT